MKYLIIIKKIKDEIGGIITKEITIDKTLYGIHHDDIVFLLDNKDINNRGSNGQKKNAIFAFKLALIELIYNEKGSYPILILDDLFSALDNKKITNIFKLLSDNIQTFITTTDLDKIDNTLIEKAKVLKVIDSGVLEE